MSCNVFNDNNSGAQPSGGGGGGSSSQGLITFDPGDYNGEAFPFTTTPEELTGFSTTYVLSAGVVDFDQPEDGRLRYTGATTRTFLVSCGFFVVNLLGFKAELRKNGSLIDSGDNSVCYEALSNNPLLSNVIVDLAQNDYLSIFAARSSSASHEVTNAFVSAFSIT